MYKVLKREKARLTEKHSFKKMDHAVTVLKRNQF